MFKSLEKTPFGGDLVPTSLVPTDSATLPARVNSIAKGNPRNLQCKRHSLAGLQETQVCRNTAPWTDYFVQRRKIQRPLALDLHVITLPNKQAIRTCRAALFSFPTRGFETRTLDSRVVRMHQSIIVVVKNATSFFFFLSFFLSASIVRLLNTNGRLACVNNMATSRALILFWRGVVAWLGVYKSSPLTEDHQRGPKYRQGHKWLTSNFLFFWI